MELLKGLLFAHVFKKLEAVVSVNNHSVFEFYGRMWQKDGVCISDFLFEAISGWFTMVW